MLKRINSKIKMPAGHKSSGKRTSNKKSSNKKNSSGKSSHKKTFRSTSRAHSPRSVSSKVSRYSYNSAVSNSLSHVSRAHSSRSRAHSPRSKLREHYTSSRGGSPRSVKSTGSDKSIKSTRSSKPITTSKKTKSTIRSNGSDTKAPKSEKADDNIFDLTKMVKNNNSVEIKKNNIITDNERAELLKEYKEISKDKWDQIPARTHMRYLRKDGNFRSGGYVIAHYVKKNGDTNQKKIHLSSSPNYYNATKWYVILDHIEKIWIKQSKSQEGSQNMSVIKDTFKTQDENIKVLNTRLDRQNVEIDQLKNELKRGIKLIKKLHNININ